MIGMEIFLLSHFLSNSTAIGDQKYDVCSYKMLFLLYFLLFSFLQVLVVQFIIGASDLNIGFQIAMQRPLQ